MKVMSFPLGNDDLVKSVYGFQSESGSGSGSGTGISGGGGCISGDSPYPGLTLTYDKSNGSTDGYIDQNNVRWQ